VRGLPDSEKCLKKATAPCRDSLPRRPANAQALSVSFRFCRVLDLGCGSGRDCYVCASLVGPTGSVTGLDMTPSLLEVARSHADEYCTSTLGYAKSNLRFVEGQIERLGEAGIADSSIDLIISNCVVSGEGQCRCRRRPRPAGTQRALCCTHAAAPGPVQRPTHKAVMHRAAGEPVARQGGCAARGVPRPGPRRRGLLLRHLLRQAPAPGGELPY
jgi:SAM-dependent methyltransferase